MKKRLLKILFILLIVPAGTALTISNSSIFQASGFNLETVTPRVFLPDEGDIVRFRIDNPNYSEISARIMDITGMEIKSELEMMETTVITWDGKDDDDRIVRGGIYIYQVESEGKIFNGSIVVAK